MKTNKLLFFIVALLLILSCKESKSQDNEFEKKNNSTSESTITPIKEKPNNTIIWISRDPAEKEIIRELNFTILKKENNQIVPLDFFRVLEDNSYFVFASTLETNPKYYRYDFNSNRKFIVKTETSLEEIKVYADKQSKK